MPSFVTRRGEVLRTVEADGSLFWSNRFSRSLTLCPVLGMPFRAGADFAELRAILSSRGEDAERYEFFTARAGIEGCFAVVPFPFDLSEEGVGLESVAAMPFVVVSV